MAELYLLRHAPTLWNIEKRIQGRTDIELNPASILELQTRALSPRLKQCQSFCSPLKRTRQTLESLGIEDHIIVDDLIEMHWGSMEGKSLKEIQQEIDSGCINPATGLDFRPPGGESPRQVRTRFANWLPRLGTGPYLAVTHKGVIRAALSLATNWDMEAPYPAEIDWHLVFHFQTGIDGSISLKAINHPLFATED